MRIVSVTPSILALVVAASICALMTFSVPEASAQEDGNDDAVDRAKQALQSADFESLVPILESTIDEDSADTTQPAKAHLLYALGIFFQASSDDEDPDLFAHVDQHIETALEHDPQIELDPLLYPPRFVTRVQQLQHQDTGSSSAGEPIDRAQIFYFERHVQSRSRLPLFLPGGIGQFYNDAYFRGVTFGLLQLFGLATNLIGYWAVESMRASSGHIPSEQISNARGWRRAQMIGIGTFFGGWGLSTIEANMNFEGQTVRIRTLDEPPDELQPFSRSSSDIGHGSLLLRWSTAF